MGTFRFSFAKIFLISSSLLFSSSVIAVDISNQSSNVFNFQKKLAAKGNVKALYKLGYMHEMGEGTSQDLAEAKICYQGAVAKSYLPAELRLTYLNIKSNGYDKEKNADWLQSVKTKSSSRDTESLEALFLLGQLYREGLGVKKDLAKAQEIMFQLSMEGVTAAEVETAKIEAELTANQQKKSLAAKRLAGKRHAEKLKQAQAAAAAKEKSVAVQAAEQESVNAEKARADKEKLEKRKRYEAVMKKLAEEQALINDLQGGEADDEI